MLIAIAIIAVLAGGIFAIASKSREKARATVRLSSIREAGSSFLAVAAENNGRCAYFGGGSGNFEYRPYLIIRNESLQKEGPMQIMHWDADKLPPNKGNEHWNCRAINFQDVTHTDGTSTKWTMQGVKDGAGRSGNLKTLSLAAVARPWSYPLVIDSSNAAGNEIFRINESAGECVGLRESGKANAFLFDGSARRMDRADLKKSGFTKAYDNSTKPPKPITL